MTTDQNNFYCRGTLDNPNNCNQVNTCWNPISGAPASQACASDDWLCVVNIFFLKLKIVST